MKNRQLIIQIFLVGLVFALFAFFRFYNLDKRISFDWDQEYLSNFLKKIIVDHKPILIGHRATDDLGFFFGPYFEYLFIPFYLFSKMDPQGLIYAIYFFNILFFGLAYFAIKKIFSVNISLIFLFLWAINYSLISWETTVWAPLIIPQGIILTWYFLYRLYKNHLLINYLMLGFTLGFFTQIHSLFFPMDIFAGLFLIIIFTTQKKQFPFKIRNFFALAGGFIIFLTPLVLFDLRHNFLNSKLFINYFFNRIQGNVDIFSTLDVYGNFLKPLLFFKNTYLTVTFHLMIFILLINLIKNRKGFIKIFYATNSIIWMMTTITFLRFNQRPSEYYFLYLYPIFTIALIDFIYKKYKYLIIPILILLVSVNFKLLANTIQVNNLGLAVKKQVVERIKNQVKGKRYNISYDMPLGLNTGYDYLLEYYNIKPSKNPKDPLIIIRLPAKENDIVINNVGIRIPPEFLINQNEK